MTSHISNNIICLIEFSNENQTSDYLTCQFESKAAISFDCPLLRII